jgi:iron complex outermembrane recepter protein
MKQHTPSFRHTALARSVLAICGASAAVIAWQPVSAQTAAPAAPAALQRVEITGSNISREDIQNSGKASGAEILQSLAVDNQGSVPIGFSNGFAQGATGISLRGLGTASTLVLINGRRIAPYGLADDGQKIFSNLNVIPMEAVERIEILKGGASAIYGSDAIAGVVNIILRKDFKGTVATANIGQSRYGDGTERKAAITTGFGNIEEDKYNVLFNFEVSKTDAIFNKDRAGRGSVGVSDGRPFGFATIGGALGGGSIGGAIVGNNAAVSSLNGNVRNPTTLDYYNRGNLAGVGFTRTFPGADCSKFSNIPQGGDLGGCLIDGTKRYAQIQPAQQNLNFFGRFTRVINPELTGYAELNLYSSTSDSQSTPSGVSGSVGFPGGPVSNAGASLGAAHPDNPYFGSTARFRYLAGDVGPRTSRTKGDFTRVVAGLKGTYDAWDFDTAFLYSQTTGNTDRKGYLQRDVAFALLNPSAANVAAARANSPAYAALPAGSFWRIGENAGLNSAAIYEALSPTISSESKARTAAIDFKASRELGKLDGGPIGLALGAELRNESIELTPTTGTDRGNVIGLGYSAYKGGRNIFALFSEAAFPISKQFEATVAARADRYTDSGSSFTPSFGAKWKPDSTVVVRGNYAQGFRAPSPAENGKGGLAAFSTAVDPVRCALNVPGACDPATVALITSPNPALKPEKSQSVSLGVVWEPAPSTSLSVDLWQIVRKNEINQEQASASIAAGRVSRDPTTASNIPGDPGAITAVLENFINSASTKVRGLDLDARHIFKLGDGYGKLTLDAKWTHLFTWRRTEQDGTSFDFAGTHGNCDTSNCAGTPADRLNLGATWEQGPWRVGTAVNYRGSLKNINFKNEEGCANAFADGTDAPSGCRVKSFTTVDVTMRYKITPKTEVFGSIRNLFDKVPPIDPLTYGAAGFNPSDYSGAVGRYFTLGLRHEFN